MKRQFFCMLLLSCTVLLNAKVDENATLLTINGNPSTVGDFLYIYQKNNQDAQIEQKTIDEYLDLFINFKLKVEAAKQAGIDTTEAFQKELRNYYKQATPKYMVDKEATDSVIDVVYNRSKTDRLASHIVVRCAEDATEEEEAAALEKIREARVRVTTGLPVKVGKGKKTTVKYNGAEDFNAVAKEMSEDPSVKVNEGRVGYVIPFHFVYSFEDMAYKTPIDSVSPIFRSPYGFHILKVESEIPHEETHIAHIMKIYPRGNDSVAAVVKQQMDSIYQVLQSGADFKEVARKESEDQSTSAKGGDMGYIPKGMFMQVPEFEEAVGTLTANGQMTEPVRTQFSWHIIKRIDKRGLQPLDSIRQKIEKNIKRSEYQKEIDDAFTNKLKTAYSFRENREALDTLLHISKNVGGSDSLFEAATASLNDPMFVIDGKEYSQADFLTFVKGNQQGKKHISERSLQRWYDTFVAKTARDAEEEHLPEKYTEFRNLVTEYHDGILLFEVSLKEVWDKATTDTAGITEFFKNNIGNYKWDEPHYKGYVVYCKDKQTAKAAKRIIQSAHPDSIESYINNRLNIDSTEYVSFEKGLWKPKMNKAVDKFGLKLKKAEYTPKEDLPVVFCVGKKLNAPEEYMDERGKVTTDYQDYLDSEWIKNLRTQFKYEVNEAVFEELKEEYK